MHYIVDVKLNKDARSRGHLIPGTVGSFMKKEAAQAVTEDRYNFEVIPAGPVTSVGNFTLLVSRRRRKDGTLVQGELSSAAVIDVAASTSIKRMKRLNQSQDPEHVTLFTEPNDKEAKNMLDGLDSIHIPSTNEDESLVEHVKIVRNLMKLTDIDALPRKGLWEAIHPEDRERARPLVYEHARPHQRPVIDYLVSDSGLVAYTGMIRGPPGCGKTDVALNALKPFVSGRVQVPRSIYHRARAQREEYLKDTPVTVPGVVIEDKSPVVNTAPKAQVLLENGRILLLSPTNEGVDSLVEKAKQLYLPYLERLGYPKVGIVRAHSLATECKASIAFTNPMFRDGELAPENLDTA